MKSLYDVLGVQANATEAEVKRAFRQQARIHHPDKGGDAERFREVNEAYETLSNAAKRKTYDWNGRSGGGSGGGGGGCGGGFGDFNFDFSGFGDFQRGSRGVGDPTSAFFDMKSGFARARKRSNDIR
jgi:DnaJ-class molecular chaperone